MNKAKNVIDLNTRRTVRSETLSRGVEPAGQVVDMTERRMEILTHERRKVRRTILTEFIAAHVVVPNRGLQKVALYDISEDGLSFDIDFAAGRFQSGEQVSFRLYINHQTYFPFVVRVSNAREIIEEGITRHGGLFVKGTINDEALHHLVKFIETVSASLKTDQGDVMVSGIRG